MSFRITRRSRASAKWGTTTRASSDNSIFLTAFGYTLENRKGSANGNADFLSSFPEPATEHDRSGSSSLTCVDYGATIMIRVCGLRTRSSLIRGVTLGRLVPRPDSAVLGGLPFTSSDSHDFRERGPRMRIDDLSVPSEIHRSCASRRHHRRSRSRPWSNCS